MLNTITYKGIEYPTREIDINIDGEPHRFTISTEELDSAMCDDEARYPSKLFGYYANVFTKDANGLDAEVQAIDENIFYYCNKKEWNMPDEELSTYLSDIIDGK